MIITSPCPKLFLHHHWDRVEMVDLCEEILQISMLVKELPASLLQSGTGEAEPMMFFRRCREMMSRVNRSTRRPRNSHTYTYTLPVRPGEEAAAADVEDEEVGEKRRRNVPLSVEGDSPVSLWSTRGTPDILALCSQSHSPLEQFTLCRNPSCSV